MIFSMPTTAPPAAAHDHRLGISSASRRCLWSVDLLLTTFAFRVILFLLSGLRGKVKNPISRPSGEKNGAVAPSVPGTGLAYKPSIGLRYSCCAPRWRRLEIPTGRSSDDSRHQHCQTQHDLLPQARVTGPVVIGLTSGAVRAS
jgi:hypothetical protein